MKSEWFDEVVEERIQTIRKSLLTKSKEYARDGERLHNFKAGGSILRTAPETALLGYMTKQFASIVDLVKDVESGAVAPLGVWNEKIGDSINYLILLEALVIERLHREPPVI